MPRRAASENVVKLTKAIVAALTPQPGKAERTVWDAEVPGFGIRVREAGGRAWVIRPPRTGGPRSKLHTLGPADKIDLSDARKVAREKLAEVALGGDPTAAKRKAREQATLTVGSLIPAYLADREKHLKPATMTNNRHALNVHWASLHDRPLNAVTRAEVADRLREIGATKPQAANRSRAILSAFFSWAMREGRADANPVTNTNTAAPPTKRERVLNDAELAAVWKACRDDDFGRIVRLLILTGQRRNEVAGMRWSEVDLGGALWTIPAERMKNGRPHEVPLSPAALEILEAAPQRAGRDLVFGDGQGAFSGFSRAKASLDKRVGDEVAEWTVHDLRRTAATGMAKIGVLPHVVEAVLSHVSGARAGVAGIYNRADYRPEKRDALDRWAAFVRVL